MRRYLASFSVPLLAILVLPINAQQNPEITKLKSFFAFNAWPGQNGSLKQGFSFNVPDYSSLSGFSISSDQTDVSSLSLGLLRKLTLVSGSQILNLVIGVAIDSPKNAQELLLDSQLAGRQIDVAVVLQRGDLHGITLGDLNFVYVGATPTSLGGAISFVRNNVMVAISDGSPDNSSTVDLFALATAIDAKIQAQANLNLSQFNGEKPVINLTPVSTSLAVAGASTAVPITVTDPTNNSGPISRQFLTKGNLTVQDNGTTLTVSPNSTSGANNLQVIANNSFLQFSTATMTFTVTEAVSGPAWSIGLAHNGIFSQSQTNAIYMIYATNVGGSATTGLATLTEMPPTGLTLVSMSGAGWTCAANKCTRSDGLASGASYSPVTVTVNVAANAPASVTNQAMISGGSVSQPATDLELTTIDSPEPVFTIRKTHTGNFVFGQTTATYTITVSNMGAVASSGTVSVTDTPQAGLTLTSISGSGWICVLPTCTRSDPLNPGAQYAAISATVSVAANAPAQVTNAATVSGAGSPTAGAKDASANVIEPTDIGNLNTDFADNGRDDALLYDPAGGTTYTALSTGNGTYSYVYNLFTSGFDTLRTGDFNGDGKADLVVYNSKNALAYIGFDNGDGTFNFQSLFWSSGYNIVEQGDINGDGQTDFALYNSPSGTLYSGISNGDGTFTYQYHLVSAGFTFIRLVDFTCDGKADLFLYNATNGLAFLGVGDGAGNFTFNPLSISPGYNLADAGDLNGDGIADLILYNSTNGNTATGISNGTGGFTFTPLIFSPGFTSVRLADYTGDGKADVSVYNKNNAAAYFGTGNGDGTFNFQSLFWSPGYDYVIPQDVNGDGKMDVVLYNSATGTEYTGISNGNGTFTYTYQYWGIGKMLAR